MVTEKEKGFLRRWEQVREKENSLTHKLLSGLPMAMMFGLPILLFFIAIKIFLPGWATTAPGNKKSDFDLPDWAVKFSQVSFGDILMVIIGVVILVLFYAYFRMHFKWEMNEQLYKELKYKENSELESAGDI